MVFDGDSVNLKIDSLQNKNLLQERSIHYSLYHSFDNASYRLFVDNAQAYSMVFLRMGYFPENSIPNLIHNLCYLFDHSFSLNYY
jgi:hypothetical protein